MTEMLRATPAATGHGPRRNDQLDGSIGSENNATNGNAQAATGRKPNQTNEREFLRREQIRRLSDSRLAQLRRELPEVQRDLDAEARRRRSESAENFHEGQTFHEGRIRFWRPCPICHDRACRSQSCRDAERHIARERQ